MTSEVFVFPVSFGQQRLWFMEQLQPGTSLFNLSIPVRLNIPVSVEILERSLNEIVRRHESLRTTFAVVDEKVVQLIKPSVEHKLVVADLTHLSPPAREEEGARLASIEAQTPFDLIHGPLLRTTLIKLDELDHIFILTMHHIISDGWSLGIFWRELNTLCEAFAVGAPSPLPDLTVQYADFSVWQRKWLQDGALDSQLAYWKRQLSDLPVPELPTDNPRPKIQTFSGARYPVLIPAELTAALKTACQREGVTLFMMVLAAFDTLLYRYTGQSDIVLGTYIAGRNRSELEAVIGFFLNSLVLRTKLNSNDSFAEVLKRVCQVTLDAYAHQDVPFAKLVEELQPARDLGRNPLFQVMFQLLNVPTLTREKDAPQPNVLEVPAVSSVFDLSFMLEETGTELTGHIEYNTALFNADSIERMFGHYLNLLEQVVGNLDQRIGDLQLQTRAEQILQAGWNRTERDYSQSGDIVSWFDAQVKLHPDAAAFFCNGEVLTYRELDRRSNKLAHFLQSQGAGPKKIVGVYLDRSFDFIVALISIFRVGAVYLPLDASYPPARLRFMIEDAKISALITKHELLRIVGGQCSNTICIDADFEELNRQPESKLEPAVKVSAEQPAYVIYTSGSTGPPKGVIVPHRQVINRLQWMWEAYPFEPGEVCCQKTAVSFVDSIWELLGPLLQGIPTVIIPDETIRDPFALIKTLGEHRVTRLWVVPSLLRLILDAEPDLEKRLPLLKFWVTSGEPLSTELLEKFQQQMPGSSLYNLYGTSEVWDVTWFDTREYKSAAHRHVPIGTPISNMKTYVVDSFFRLAPIGIPGELWVGGDGLATSYLGEPALSAEKFVPDVFSAEAGAKLYRTGDLVRYLPNGDIEYLQRIDTQVKVRGFRVELGEVESALCRCPGVKEAVVVIQDAAGAEKRVVGYVVMNGLHPLTMTDLRTLLKEVLPDHMIPAALVPMESLPLLPNGKIDRLQLPKPKGDERQVNGKHVPPGSEAEMIIAGVWSDVLQFEQVGIHDNFFDLGGHSILLFQVYSKLRSRFDQQFSITDLFKYPTVSALANYFTAGPAQDAATLQNVRDRVQKHRQSFSHTQVQAG